MKPSAIAKLLPSMLAKRRPTFLWGAPGVGKSDIVRQVAGKMGYELRDVRMSMLDPTDIKGFPMPNVAKKQMNWLPADFLPTKGKGILFLDEMNGAPQAVQASAYQLVLDFKVGNYELPPGWSILAAGNRMSDRSIVHAQPAALANRFVHIDYDVDADDWNVWAMENKIHIDLRAFIRFRPNLLHKFDPKDNPRAFPSPRSWAFVNDIYQEQHTSKDEFELIRGTVGDGAGSEFSAFVRLIKDLPTVDAVLLDPDGTRLPENPASQHALVIALETKATPNNFARVMKYIERMSIEFQTVFIRGALRRDAGLENTKTFIDWGTRHQEILK